MKLAYVTDKFGRALGGMIGVNLNDKYVKLSKAEIETIRQAEEICKRADKMHRDYEQDEDAYNSFLSAWVALSEITEDY